ncbi:MAG: cell division/cell wall cluster transcriptional repressor MraZ [Rhodobacterales bacterium]|nr:cell division/cell wall cluster transcriptional repressor MraZ [Rhodobacterales bacterium]
MVLSFTGEYTQRVDGKGRVSIPADFRRVLEAGDPDWARDKPVGLKILYGDHLEQRLHVYTLAAFREIEAGILALPRGDENRRHAARLILGQSLSAEVDKDGRVVIPQRQRDKIGLTDGDVYFTGLGEYFEVWKAETYAATDGMETKAWLESKPKGYDPLSVLSQAGG